MTSAPKNDIGTVADEVLILEDCPTPYRTANGNPVWISTTPDCEYNEGGLYVQIYKDPSMDTQIDDMTVDATTVLAGEQAVEKAIQDYIGEIQEF